MKRILWILPAVLFLSMSAHAQEIPEWEIFGGYTFMRANVNGSGPSFNLHGGEGALDENMNDWFGGRVEIKVYGATVGGKQLTAQTYTFGPVFSSRRFEKFTPEAHVEFGGVHASTGYFGISQSAYKFAMTTGGGIEYYVNKTVGIRVQADYLLTNFQDARQDNIQCAAGIVFHIGSR